MRQTGPSARQLVHEAFSLFRTPKSSFRSANVAADALAKHHAAVSCGIIAKLPSIALGALRL
jgi:hypothetical protein